MTDNMIGGIFILAFIAAWVTHLIVCLSAQAWGLLIAGAFFPPIGIFHGFLSWFGMTFV